MTLTSILLFAGALFVNSASPGPGIAALTARTLSRGWRNVLPFAVAFWVGEAVWLAAAVFGLGLVAKAFYTVFLVLKMAGVAYLLFLAWKMWNAPAHLDPDATAARSSGTSMFLAGLALTMGNPKIMVFYLALLPAVVDLSAVSLAGWAQLTITLLVTLAVVDLGYIMLAERARGWLRSPRAVRLANRIGAGAMTGAAAVVALDAA